MSVDRSTLLTSLNSINSYHPHFYPFNINFLPIIAIDSSIDCIYIHSSLIARGYEPNVLGFLVETIVISLISVVFIVEIEIVVVSDQFVVDHSSFIIYYASYHRYERSEGNTIARELGPSVCLPVKSFYSSSYRVLLISERNNAERDPAYLRRRVPPSTGRSIL